MPVDTRYLDFLRGLAGNSADVEVRQKLADALPELVARVGDAAGAKGAAIRAVVIDELQTDGRDFADGECRVPVRYQASASRDGEKRDLQRLSGRAVAVLDDEGRVRYRDVTVGALDRAFQPHDVGGGD